MQCLHKYLCNVIRITIRFKNPFYREITCSGNIQCRSFFSTGKNQAVELRLDELFHCQLNLQIGI